MSAPTTLYADDDFDDLEFAAIVADFDTDQPDPRRRTSRAAERRAGREAIERELGIYRHRTGERREV
jgi:hypothetical protein